MRREAETSKRFGAPAPEQVEHVTANTVARWRSEGMDFQEINRIIKSDRITAQEFSAWFSLVPGNPGPWPSGESLDRLVSEVWMLREGGWPYAIIEERQKRYEIVRDRVRELRLAVKAWQELKVDDSDELRSEQIDDLMRCLNQVPIVGATEKLEPARGRPKTDWHKYAKEFANILRDNLRACGFKGALGFKKESGAICVIGAKYISRTVGITLDSAGFASAMRSRDRSKRGAARKELLFGPPQAS